MGVFFSSCGDCVTRSIPFLVFMGISAKQFIIVMVVVCHSLTANAVNWKCKAMMLALGTALGGAMITTWVNLPKPPDPNVQVKELENKRVAEFKEWFEKNSKKEDEISVVHLGQMHSVSKKFNNTVLKSQSQILSYLRDALKQGKVLVFAEGLDAIVNSKNRDIYSDSIKGISSSAVLEYADTQEAIGKTWSAAALRFYVHFPNGLPKNDVEFWTKAQQEWLGIHGAVFALFFSRELPTIYPTLNVEFETRNEKAIDRESKFKQMSLDGKDIILYQREIFALKSVVNNSTGDRVVLVYGSDHNFEKYAQPNLKIEKVDLSKPLAK